MNQAVDIHVVDGELRVDVAQVPPPWWRRAPARSSRPVAIRWLAGGLYIAAAPASESTDDAYVEADHVAARSTRARCRGARTTTKPCGRSTRPHRCRRFTHAWRPPMPIY